MKKVKYKKWIPLVYIGDGAFKRILENTNCWESDYFNDGLFHQWANSYEEFESGPGNYTIALVEIEDGTIVEVLPCNIKFIKE